MLQNYLWFIYSLTAAMLWGVHYATAGHLSKTIPPSLISVAYLVFVAIAAIGFMVIFLRPALDIKQLGSYVNVASASLLGLMVLTGCIGNILVFYAIADSTATKASIIEITYPIFVALFSLLLFREDTLNVQTGIGGILILVGAVIVAKS